MLSKGPFCQQLQNCQRGRTICQKGARRCMYRYALPFLSMAASAICQERKLARLYSRFLKGQPFNGCLRSSLLMTSLPAICASAIATPVLNGGVVNYQTNKISLRGSRFEPATTAPAVLFDVGLKNVACTCVHWILCCSNGAEDA